MAEGCQDEHPRDGHRVGSPHSPNSRQIEVQFLLDVEEEEDPVPRLI